MAHYTQITQAEMENFLAVGEDGKPLEKGGFHRISVVGTKELVYAKIVASNTSLRIYSSLVGGAARGNGEDAIRVTVFWRSNETDTPRMIGTSKRVHRVLGWKANLTARINDWKEGIGEPCLCGAPTVWRSKAKFFGCCLFPNCPKNPRHQPNPTN